MRRECAALLALTGMALPAQDISGGVFMGLSIPVGDLEDKFGYGTNQYFGTHVGGFVDITLTPHHEVRTHLSYHDLPGSAWNGWNNQNDFKFLQLGADWIYHFRNPSQGWYTIAGASINSIKEDSSLNFYYYSPSGYTKSGLLGIRGGGGYAFNKLFSVEGTVNQVFLNQNGGAPFGLDTAIWVQASAVFHFGR
jgi:hypothetical protein